MSPFDDIGWIGVSLNIRVTMIVLLHRVKLSYTHLSVSSGNQNYFECKASRFVYSTVRNMADKLPKYLAPSKP